MVNKYRFHTFVDTCDTCERRRVEIDEMRMYRDSVLLKGSYT